MMHLKYEKPLHKNYQKLVLLNVDRINQNPLENFAKSYRFLGGSVIPDEVVNMIIRESLKKMHGENEYVTEKKAFLDIAQVIHSISGIKGKDLWRLTNTFCIYQYNFEIGYLQWLRLRAISRFIYV